MLAKLFSEIAVGILGLFLAVRLIGNVSFSGTLQAFLFAGFVLGLINFFIRPLIRKVTWPLRMLTLGLFSLVINMVILWFVDVIFLELNILGLKALFLSALIISLLDIFIPSK
jgi:putative membrane protein